MAHLAVEPCRQDKTRQIPRKNDHHVSNVNTPTTCDTVEDNQNEWPEESVNITDIFQHFRTECLRQAKDVRNFAAEHETLDIGEEKYTELLRMTGTLKEQHTFLDDTWTAVQHHIDHNPMQEEELDTYRGMEKAKAHATRVVGLAFSITEQFRTLYNKGKATTHKEITAKPISSPPGANGDTNKLLDLKIKRATRGDKELRDIARCNRMVLTAMEKAAAQRCNDPLRERISKLRQINETLITKKNGEDDKATQDTQADEENPKLLAILDTHLANLASATDIAHKRLTHILERRSNKRGLVKVKGVRDETYEGLANLFEEKTSAAEGQIEVIEEATRDETPIRKSETVEIGGELLPCVYDKPIEWNHNNKYEARPLISTEAGGRRENKRPLTSTEAGGRRERE